MAKLTWDNIGDRLYETGVSKGALFVMGATGYEKGVAWNGLTAVTESPEGGEPNDIYADDILYLSLFSAEKFKGTIEAYTYPEEFEVCDGSASIVAGATIGLQNRKNFGLAYTTIVGNDTDKQGYGEKLHLVYGCQASPSERAYATVNDSPEAITFSWEFTSTPVAVEGYKPTSTFVFDSTKLEAGKYQAICDLVYGSASKEPSLPTPAEILTLLAV